MKSGLLGSCFGTGFLAVGFGGLLGFVARSFGFITSSFSFALVASSSFFFVARGFGFVSRCNGNHSDEREGDKQVLHSAKVLPVYLKLCNPKFLFKWTSGLAEQTGYKTLTLSIRRWQRHFESVVFSVRCRAHGQKTIGCGTHRFHSLFRTCSPASTSKNGQILTRNAKNTGKLPQNSSKAAKIQEFRLREIPLHIPLQEFKLREITQAKVIQEFKLRDQRLMKLLQEFKLLDRGQLLMKQEFKLRDRHPKLMKQEFKLSEIAHHKVKQEF